MLTLFDKLMILFTILGVCIGVAIIICYLIYLKIEDRRLEKSRRYCIELKKINAENKSPYWEKIITDEIIGEIRKIRSELDSVFDKLENIEIE